MPPILDPLRIFAANGPIPLIVLSHLLQDTLNTLPGYPTASAGDQAAFRTFVQHAIATYNPGDTQEAMMAATIVVIRAQMSEAYRLAGEPGMPVNLAARCRSQGTSLARCLGQAENRLLHARTLRLKEAETPSERSGWCSYDASVPLPGAAPSAEGAEDLMHREPQPAPAAAESPPRQLDPMPSEKPGEKPAEKPARPQPETPRAAQAPRPPAPPAAPQRTAGLPAQATPAPARNQAAFPQLEPMVWPAGTGLAGQPPRAQEHRAGR